jgi:hypothetical protein
MPSANSKAARQLAALLSSSTRSVSDVAGRKSTPRPISKSRRAASRPAQVPATPPPPPAAGTLQVNASESENTCSDLLAGQNKKSCAATNKKGNPCGAHPCPGSDFCPFHRPEYAEQMQESRIEGGRRRAIYQAPDIIENNLAFINLGLENPSGLQGAIEGIMRLILLGRIPPRHASILMRYLNGAIRNYPNIRKTPSPDGEEFYQVVHDLCLYSGLIERDLDDQALRERVQRIGDAGATRQEILKANEAFGYTPSSEPRPSGSGRAWSGRAMEAWDYDKPHRERESLIRAFWGPGSGEGGKLTMQDLFPNGIPEHQRRE